MKNQVLICDQLYWIYFKFNRTLYIYIYIFVKYHTIKDYKRCGSADVRITKLGVTENI